MPPGPVPGRASRPLRAELLFKHTRGKLCPFFALPLPLPSQLRPTACFCDTSGAKAQHNSTPTLANTPTPFPAPAALCCASPPIAAISSQNITNLGQCSRSLSSSPCCCLLPPVAAITQKKQPGKRSYCHTSSLPFTLPPCSIPCAKRCVPWRAFLLPLALPLPLLSAASHPALHQSPNYTPWRPFPLPLPLPLLSAAPLRSLLRRCRAASHRAAPCRPWRELVLQLSVLLSYRLPAQVLFPIQVFLLRGGGASDSGS